jgi:Domain of Unknown Function (DUF1080)
MARCFFLVLPFLLPLSAFAQQPGESEGELLFNNKDFSGWLKYTNDKSADKEKLIQKDPFDHHIIIKGTSPGYLITEKMYRNYQLSFEYRWFIHLTEQPVKPLDFNELRSGVLFHIASEGDAIWHKSIKAQLRPERAGDLQVLSGFELNVNSERADPASKSNFLRSHDGVEKPIGEWNQVTITCHGKFVSISINGTKVMTARDAEFSRGRIALQSEKGEIHFRNIRIKQLEGKPVDPDKEP